MADLIIEEDKSTSYAPRTYHNAHIADLTVAIAIDFTTAGERLTKKASTNHYIAISIDSDPVASAREIYKILRERNLHTLNIAGNGIYTFAKHGISQMDVNKFLIELLTPLCIHWKIDMLYSGGQTGADISAAVAAKFLGIPCTMRYPKGYKLRYENGVDVNTTPSELTRYINDMFNELC